MNIIKLTLAALLLLALVALTGAARPDPAGAAADEPGQGITVTGTADIRAVPDRATLTFGVQTEGSTAAKALAANSAAVRRLIAALEEAGVESKDLETEQLDVSPRWDADPDRVPEARGYVASSSLTVSDQPLPRASRLGDAAVRAGADTVSGPNLEVGEREAQYRRALARAFDDAKRKAEVLAEAAGASVGDVTAISEQTVDHGPIYTMAARSADASTPIEPGSQAISASVTVTFALGG